MIPNSKVTEKQAMYKTVYFIKFTKFTAYNINIPFYEIYTSVTFR